MLVEIEDNPNTRGCDQFVYAEIGAPKRLKAILAEDRGVETLYDVSGVGADGAFGPAFAVKITDSSDGFAFLIYGAEWGIRLRAGAAAEPWDLENPRQWGEPFKIYGSEADLVYEQG
jgi:hypothetical protein